MFHKILIAEDQGGANLSVQVVMKDLGMLNQSHAYTCDDALTQLRNALTAGEGFDLLVTDLSFDRTDTGARITDGREMIRAAQSLQPGLKILVFSAESRPAAIRALFDEFRVDGFVRKARYDVEELKKAVAMLAQNRRYYPAELRQASSAQQQKHSFTKGDKAIVKLLLAGKSQREMPPLLEAAGIEPTSLSSIEKRLKLMRRSLGFSNNNQLVVFCEEMGLTGNSDH